jgi:hypothetical protein
MTSDEGRQQWRFIGAIAVLGAIGMLGLLIGYGFSNHANDLQTKSLHERLNNQAGEILTNRARITQLEEDYTSRGIPIPAVPTTTTSPRARSSPTARPSPSSTTSTTRPPSTTTTTVPPKPCTVNLGGVCIR